MKKAMVRLVPGVALALNLACDSGSERGRDCTNSLTGDECSPNTFTDTGADCVCEGTDTDTDADASAGPASWSAEGAPCSGSRLDALYCESESTCYTGCGSNSEGAGLFVTYDGGVSWSLAEDSSNGAFFDSFRVLDIQAADGLLYVAGTGTTSHRVVSFDPGSGELGEIYNNVSIVDYSMTVGSYALRSDGLEIAESLTGAGLVVRKRNDSAFLETYADYEGWASAYGWWNSVENSGQTQVLDMAVVDDQIIGAGAQINVPPVVYLPPRGWDFATDSNRDGDLDQLFEMVELADGFDSYNGECWQIDGNEDGLAVVCVDQDADQGRVYTIGADWQTSAYDYANWTKTNIEDVVSVALDDGHSTWNEGVCRGPDDRVVVVGRDSQTDEGYVVYSADGGQGWVEVTADVVAAAGSDLGPVTRCLFTSDHLVIGGPGLLASIAISGL